MIVLTSVVLYYCCKSLRLKQFKKYFWIYIKMNMGFSDVRCRIANPNIFINKNINRISDENKSRSREYRLQNI